jgi:hypothetical protein
VLLLTTTPADRCRRRCPPVQAGAEEPAKDIPLTAELTADMSAAPEIAILAGAASFVPARPQTLGTLARQLRLLAASPERWWGLVRFDPDRSVRIEIEHQPEYGAWLVVMPPGDAGQDCDCDVATVIAGEATEGAPGSAVLRPGPTRVHGQRHRLRGHGADYSISLHARAVPPAPGHTQAVPPQPTPGPHSANPEFAIHRHAMSE